MFKRFLSLLLVLFCSFILIGCEKDKNTEHEAITIMDGQRDYSNLIALVKEKYPEINIEVIPYRGRNMSAYMKQQLETGRMPDIYTTTQAWSEEFQQKYLVDLNKYKVSELYSQARLSKYNIDGSLYLLPFDYSINGILYNKSLFERLNINVPTSFDELQNETIQALINAEVQIADCLLDLPGSAFNYFFNISSTLFMNTNEGRNWRNSFCDVNSSTFASDNENIIKCTELFQEWIDCGMINFDDISKNYSEIIANFTKGNTAFLVGTVHQFTQYSDGSGDEYGLMPYLSSDGKNNNYITSPTRLYGLNKDLVKEENKQKLEDALHILEVLSTNEGYIAINGSESTNMCSIKDFNVSEVGKPYEEAMKQVSLGYSMDLVYTGWENYLATFGNALLSWIEGNSTSTEALKILDDTKRSIKEKGVTYYATCTEELSTIQAAQLCGQMFMEATEASVALISYNVYSPKVNALMGNSYGVNGTILKGKMTEENITIFLPTGWSETLVTAEFSGKKIKEMAEEGCDTRGTGYKFPYVLMTKDGKDLEDDAIYKVVLCGYNKSEKDTLGIIKTDIVGLDAAKAYLLKVKEVSTAILDDSLVKYITPVTE